MKNLRRLRLDRKMTQTMLAARLRTGAANVSKWEAGKTQARLGTRLRIAKVLRCEVADL